MAGQIFHSFQLAPGAVAQDFRVESLAQDPVPLVANRMWHNSTTNTFNFTGLDGTGAVIVHSFATAADMAAAAAATATNLAAEVTRATAAEGKLTTDLATEVARAQAAELSITTSVSTEVARAQAAEATLTTNLAAEVTRAEGVEATLTTNLAAEVTRAQGAEATLTTNLTAEVTRATAAEGTLTTNLAAEVARAQAAEATLTTNVAANAAAIVSGDAATLASAKAYTDGAVTGLWDDRGNFDASANAFPSTGGSGVAGAINKGDIWTINVAGTLGGVPVVAGETVRALKDAPAVAADWAIGLANTNIADTVTSGVVGVAPSQNAVYVAIAAEATARTTAIAAEATARDAAILVETNRATAAEGTLTTNLATEVTRATAAEGTLTTNLAAEVTNRTAADAGLQTQIDALVAAGSSNTLKSALNANRYQYASSAPATVHTIVHNMNTSFYSADLRVQDSGGVWRNDIAPIADVDANSFTVTLSVAANIRISGQNNAALA